MRGLVRNVRHYSEKSSPRLRGNGSRVRDVGPRPDRRALSQAGQVSVTELDRAGGWHRTPNWDLSARQRVLELIVRKGLVDVDRNMEPWLIAPVADVDQA